MLRSLLVAAGLAAFGSAAVAAAPHLDEPSAACARAAQAEKFDDAALRTCDYAIERRAPIAVHDLYASHVNRGVILLNRGEWAKAQRDFDRAVRLNPGVAEGYVNRATSRIRLGKYREALADLDRGIELKPVAPARAHYNRGLVRRQLGDLQGAEADFRRAAELEPQWGPPQAALVRVAAPAG